MPIKDVRIREKSLYRLFIVLSNKALPREHEGTERDTEGVGCDMSYPLKLFLVSGSLFSETSARITTSI